MNEVRNIVARMMEDPAPPLRPAEELLAVARRAKRRHSWATAAGSGVLALAMIVGVGVAVRTLPGSEVNSPSEARPVAQAAAAHGEAMAQRIVAALPEGIAAGYLETFSDATTVPSGPDGDAGRILAAAVVRVFGDDSEGELYAYLVRDGAPGAPCSPGADDCWSVLVGEVTIQVATSVDPDRGSKIEATRFLDNGRLIIGAWSGPPANGIGPTGARYEVTWPPLPEPPLDASALAALAADPAMLSV